MDVSITCVHDMCMCFVSSIFHVDMFCLKHFSCSLMCVKPLFGRKWAFLLFFFYHSALHLHDYETLISHVKLWYMRFFFKPRHCIPKVWLQYIREGSVSVQLIINRNQVYSVCVATVLRVLFERKLTLFGKTLPNWWTVYLLLEYSLILLLLIAEILLS